MTRKEFEELAKKNNWETFTQRQVYQFSQELLKSVDLKEREWGAIDFVSLTRQEVVNDDLTKSIVFWREQQVIWDKAENGELMKARSGVYKDTPVNRKKGIVGMRYGQEKKEVKDPKEEDRPHYSTNPKDSRSNHVIRRNAVSGAKTVSEAIGEMNAIKSNISTYEDIEKKKGKLPQVLQKQLDINKKRFEELDKILKEKFGTSYDEYWKKEEISRSSKRPSDKR